MKWPISVYMSKEVIIWGLLVLDTGSDMEPFSRFNAATVTGQQLLIFFFFPLSSSAGKHYKIKVVDGFLESSSWFSLATGTTMELFLDLQEQVGSISSLFASCALCQPPIALGSSNHKTCHYISQSPFNTFQFKGVLWFATGGNNGSQLQS